MGKMPKFGPNFDHTKFLGALIRGVALPKTDGDFFTEIFNINVSKIAVCYMNIY